MPTKPKAAVYAASRMSDPKSGDGIWGEIITEGNPRWNPVAKSPLAYNLEERKVAALFRVGDEALGLDGRIWSVVKMRKKGRLKKLEWAIKPRPAQAGSAAHRNQGAASRGTRSFRNQSGPMSRLGARVCGGCVFDM